MEVVRRSWLHSGTSLLVVTVVLLAAATTVFASAPSTSSLVELENQAGNGAYFTFEAIPIKGKLNSHLTPLTVPKQSKQKKKIFNKNKQKIFPQNS